MRARYLGSIMILVALAGSFTAVQAQTATASLTLGRTPVALDADTGTTLAKLRAEGLGISNMANSGWYTIYKTSRLESGEQLGAIDGRSGRVDAVIQNWASPADSTSFLFARALASAMMSIVPPASPAHPGETLCSIRTYLELMGPVEDRSVSIRCSDRVISIGATVTGPSRFESKASLGVTLRRPR